MKEQREERGLIVAKAGGSLIDVLPEILAVLKEAKQDILIIPGGGVFADCVRNADPKPEAAHWMAVLGMEQYGYYISSFGINTTDSLKRDEIPMGVSVLLPYKILKEKDPLPHTWDVTSDSIAAWIAGILSADLVLLKSVDGIRSGAGILEEVCEDVPSGEVDPYLIPMVLEKNIDTRVINARKKDLLENFISGRKFCGTHIHRKLLSADTPNL